jgi:uncharacterized Fe-S cluster-containing MiaB family protein
VYVWHFVENHITEENGAQRSSNVGNGLWSEDDAMYEGRYENSALFFLRKFNCNNNEIYMSGSCVFCNYGAIFHKDFVIFNALLPTFSKTLYQC